MTISGSAGQIVTALADGRGWASDGAFVEMAGLDERRLAAILLSLEDRAEDLYEAATGRRAASCMLATAWLYSQPFCRAAVGEIEARGADYLALKHEVRRHD